jgi:predicted enzyme related to lactoylglutathione lyase
MALVVWYMEHTAIKGRGGQLASEPADMPGGVRAFDLVDSDGFLLTISSEM